MRRAVNVVLIVWAVATAIVNPNRADQTSPLRHLAAVGVVFVLAIALNRRLRARVDELMAGLGGRAFYPRAELCTDNGAMIAYAGWQRLHTGQQEGLGFGVRPRWPMQELVAGA